MAFANCAKELNDHLAHGLVIAAGSRTRVYVHRNYARSWLIYSIRFRQHDDNNNLDSLLTSASVESTPAMEVETMQDERQIKWMNFASTNNQLIPEQFQVGGGNLPRFALCRDEFSSVLSSFLGLGNRRMVRSITPCYNG